MPKYIKEVFNDYGINNNLIEAEIENINLYKLAKIGGGMFAFQKDS